MPPPSRKSITAPITPVFQQGLSASDAKQEAAGTLALLPKYQRRVEELVVNSPDSYELADALLGQVHDMRRGWGNIWKRIQEKTVKPIRAGLEELYNLDRGVDRPLEALETGIKAKMTEYKRAEKAAADAIERTVQAERDRIARLAQEAEQRAQAARTPQMRARLEKEAARLEQQSTVIGAEVITPVTGRDSGVRQKTLPRVTDLAQFLVGIIEGTIPEDHIIINERKLEQSWKQDAAGVEKWPGVTVSSEISVVTRGR